MLENVLIWAVIAAILGVTVVRKAVIIVHQGYEYTLERFGRYSTTLRPEGDKRSAVLEATGILSSLAGITEVAKEAFAPRPGETA